MKHAGRAPWVAVALLTSCGAEQPSHTLPAPVSVPAMARPGQLRAGFGRADITPPPGIGLGGYGLENQQAEGYRHRLYVRALVLEDGRGERLALAVADLPHVSAVLHRLAADRLARAGTGLGADRFVLSATHSHSAPGNFYEAHTYNAQSGRFGGYDPHLVNFLVDKIVAAVTDALSDLGPAAAGWGSAQVDGLTRNRSITSFRLNPRPTLTPVDPSLPDTFQAVDRTFSMLRVDRCPPGWSGKCQPLGAFSIFAIHGTGYPAPSPLLDGDIHAIVERKLERHIDERSPEAARCKTGSQALVLCGFRPGAVHLFANGTPGDVSPTLPAGTRCGTLLRFRFRRRVAGPRGAPAAEEWRAPPDRMAACLDRARAGVERVGSALADSAVALFERITTSSHLTLDRAARTVDLHAAGEALEVCPQPLTGTANYAGGEDGRTRLDGWKLFWFWPTRIEQGGSARRSSPTGCHGSKVIGLGPVQRLVVRRYGLPSFAQLNLFRIGPRLLGFVPAEVTTEAGMRMKRSMAPPGDSALVVSLAGGFMQYVTTAEEYEAQRYEGGSNIYGPGTAALLERHLGELARSLAAGRPVVELLPIEARPGAMDSYFRRVTDGPRPTDSLRAILSGDAGPSRVTITWRDVAPGLMAPAEGQVLEIQIRDDPAAPWRHAAWDDQSEVEVRALGRVKGGSSWEVRWMGGCSAPAEVRLVLPARRSSGVREHTGLPVRCKG